ncbi:MAG: S1C family serine protease [Faecousia sp.]
MDNFENQSMNTEPESSEPARPSRKVSPFEDSPYVMNHQAASQNEYAQSQPYEPAKPPKKKSGVLKTVVASVLVVALVAAGCAITGISVNSYWEDRNGQMEEQLNKLNTRLEQMQQQMESNSFTGNGNSISGTPNTSADGLTPAQVYAQNVKCVVAINNEVTTNIFGQVSQTASSGSGFILSEDGYIVSNYHVVEGASKLTVILYDGTEYEAKLVGYDDTNDVSLLKIEASGLPYATIGSSDDLIVGDQVVAIGNPLGELTSTLTVGYVSAKDRDVSTDGTVINMLQTDAAINPGNSGGPLFNMKGEVVGITTAKYSGTTSSGASIEGIGFAIPIDDVVGKITDLKELGYITGAYLGVEILNLDTSTMETLGMPAGAYVRNVTDGYCAKKAGLRSMDVIIDLGGYSVESLNDLSRALQKFKAGDATTITVWRAGTEMTFDITLDEKPQTNQQSVQPQSSELPQNGSAEDWYNYWLPQFGG